MSPFECILWLYILFPDDIMLLSHSVNAVRYMLQVCDQLAVVQSTNAKIYGPDTTTADSYMITGV